MKDLSILSYPDAFLEAALTFLSNPSLLTVFVTIIFKKTK